jgi:di/tricarboxylate transporter
MVLTRLVTLRQAYESIDWAIIVLLGALIPIGQAFGTTGAAGTVAQNIIHLGSYGSPTLMLAVILIGTMFLSDVINNAAAAILMAPIAAQVAVGLGASMDPFLMSVAIGASCAFLTPIGHQSNTMVMGAGGYKFGDYWKLGLPLEIIIVIISLPLLQYFWPL